MYFNTKNYLKNTSNHVAKHARQSLNTAMAPSNQRKTGVRIPPVDWTVSCPLLFTLDPHDYCPFLPNNPPTTY